LFLLANDSNSFFVLILVSGEDDAGTSLVPNLTNSRSILSNQELVQGSLALNLSSEASELLLVAKLNEDLLALHHIILGSPNGHLIRRLLATSIGELDVHTTTLFTNATDELASLSYDGVVKLGRDQDINCGDIGKLGLDLSDTSLCLLTIFLLASDYNFIRSIRILAREVNTDVTFLPDFVDVRATLTDDKLHELLEDGQLNLEVVLQQ